jgi:hypothetical protein
MGASEPILRIFSANLQLSWKLRTIAAKLRSIPGSVSTLIERRDDGVGHGTFKSENPSRLTIPVRAVSHAAREPIGRLAP